MCLTKWGCILLFIKLDIIEYAYDAWGNCTTASDTVDLALARANPIRYRGYYYDQDTELYYLNSRYYSPVWRRFISPDDTAYLDPESVNGLNLYCYCNNDPVNYADESGHTPDFILDLFFIGYDVYNLIANGGWKDWRNWAALATDVMFAVVPFATGGSGQIVKLANLADNVYDFNKMTVVGETMTRVQTISQFVNASDNLYGGFQAYNKLSSLGKGGKALAEIVGKAHNLSWLYVKLRKGFTIVDIGIDVGKVSETTGKMIRSSSYLFESILLKIWKYRNVWKLPYHIF